MNPDLHPRKDAWLREISPGQGDLFTDRNTALAGGSMLSKGDEDAG